MTRLTLEDVREATQSVAVALLEDVDRFTELDQAIGDGDLGVTVTKLAATLKNQAETDSSTELGRYFVSVGMAINRAAPSTMGTLLATALLRAGKAASDKTELSDNDLAAILDAASKGIQERGKANVGDKTILDALVPSARAFSEAIRNGQSRANAAHQALEAAKSGRDRVTPQRSRVGRAGWVGERTEGKVDPGCELWVTVLTALLGEMPKK